jgi:hypothetical protein
MIYCPINHVQRIFLKIHIHQNGIVWQVIIQWVAKHIELDLYNIYETLGFFAK